VVKVNGNNNAHARACRGLVNIFGFIRKTPDHPDHSRDDAAFYLDHLP